MAKLFLKLIFPRIVHAQIINPSVLEIFGSNESGASAIPQIVSTFIGILLVVGVLACFAYFILNAIKWITAGGDKNKLQEAQKGLIQAMVGLLILFCLFAVMNLLEIFFGVDLLQLEIPNIFGGGRYGDRCTTNSCMPGLTCCPNTGWCTDNPSECGMEDDP